MRKISQALTIELTSYLLDHEDDIALSMDDFGELAGAFMEIIGRRPRKSSACGSIGTATASGSARTGGVDRGQ